MKQKDIDRAIALALPLIQFSEGCKLEAYPDPATGGEPWTIGWGATGKDIKEGTVWTQKQADSDLDKRTKTLAKQVLSIVKVPLAPHQLAALISFTYNLGLTNLQSSTLLKLLNMNSFTGAAREFNRWIYANGTPMAGLISRRRREMHLFDSGEWDI